MPTPNTSAEVPNRTITRFDSEFTVGVANSEKKISITVDVLCTKLSRSLHSVILYGGPTPVDLVENAAELNDEELIYLDENGAKKNCLGKDLVNRTVSVVSEIAKLDPQGMELDEGEIQNDIELTLQYSFKAEDEPLVDVVEIKGLYPRKPVESFRTAFKFN